MKLRALVRSWVPHAGAVLAAAMVIGTLGVAATASALTVNIGSTTDNYYDLWFDGSLLVTIPPSQWNSVNPGWQDAETTLISPVNLGTHVVAVEGYNYLSGNANNPGGFLAQISDGPGTYFDGNPAKTMLLTDATWKVWYGGPAGVPPVDGAGRNWKQAGYDTAATGWIAAVTEDFNVPSSRWGATIANIDPTAQWIWDADTTVSGVAHTPVYLRCEFTFDGESSGGVDVVPEPLTMLGMFLGLGSVGAYIRKRRRA